MDSKVLYFRQNVFKKKFCEFEICLDEGTYTFGATWEFSKSIWQNKIFEIYLKSVQLNIIFSKILKKSIFMKHFIIFELGSRILDEILL